MVGNNSRARAIAGIWASRKARRYFSMSGSIGSVVLRSRVVVERSVRRLCIALNRSAEASATCEIRLVALRRPQDSWAVSESAITTQTDVIAITAFSNADTVRRFSIEAPNSKKFKI